MINDELNFFIRNMAYLFKALFKESLFKFMQFFSIFINFEKNLCNIFFFSIFIVYVLCVLFLIPHIFGIYFFIIFFSIVSYYILYYKGVYTCTK